MSAIQAFQKLAASVETIPMQPFVPFGLPSGWIPSPVRLEVKSGIRGMKNCVAPARKPPSFEPARLCAALDGFSLHAQVHVPTEDRGRLEHLCRYVTRPAIAAERLSLSPQGKVVWELPLPWRDGSPSQRPTGLARATRGIDRVLACVPTGERAGRGRSPR